MAPKDLTPSAHGRLAPAEASLGSKNRAVGHDGRCAYAVERALWMLATLSPKTVMRSPYHPRDIQTETPMAWLPLDRIFLSSPCILQADGCLYVGDPLHLRAFGQPEDWFFLLLAPTGRWRWQLNLPAGEDRIVIDRIYPDEDGFFVEACIAAWLRCFLGFETRWSHLPPWLVSAHDLFQALEAPA